MNEAPGFLLTRAAYYADFVMAPAAIIAAVSIGYRSGSAFPAWHLAAAAGVTSWTFAEYIVHRFVLHRVYRKEHDVHHCRPTAYVGVSPLQTASIFTLVAIAAVMLFGQVLGSGWFAGLMIGYLAYIWVHDTIHHRRPAKRHWLRASFDRHMLHHGGVEANFGVVTPFWDHCFGTFATGVRQ